MKSYLLIPLIWGLSCYLEASTDGPCGASEDDRLDALRSLVDLHESVFRSENEEKFYLESFVGKYENAYPEPLKNDLIWVMPNMPEFGTKAGIYSSCNIQKSGRYSHTSICKVEFDSGLAICEASKIYVPVE
ncbi:hypothetical protein [Microbulbifer sp. ZKSA002]|uniref:hypothetical protein n=1 Tax=Microbulbifer sp. ZKSA002 TaxID=3243388 RepID=UPI00403A643E